MKLISGYTVENLMNKSVLMSGGQSVLDGNNVYLLNETAKWCISQLEEERTFEELTALAEEEFGAEGQEEKDIIKADMQSFLDELRRKGLLEE